MASVARTERDQDGDWAWGTHSERSGRRAGTSRGGQEVMAREAGDKQVSATAALETRRKECFRGTERQIVKCCGEGQRQQD